MIICFFLVCLLQLEPNFITSMTTILSASKSSMKRLFDIEQIASFPPVLSGVRFYDSTVHIYLHFGWFRSIVSSLLFYGFVWGWNSSKVPTEAIPANLLYVPVLTQVYVSIKYMVLFVKAWSIACTWQIILNVISVLTPSISVKEATLFLPPFTASFVART